MGSWDSRPSKRCGQKGHMFFNVPLRRQTFLSSRAGVRDRRVARERNRHRLVVPCARRHDHGGPPPPAQSGRSICRRSVSLRPTCRRPADSHSPTPYKTPVRDRRCAGGDWRAIFGGSGTHGWAMSSPARGAQRNPLRPTKALSMQLAAVSSTR